MSVRNIVLFEGGKASLAMRLQCAQKGALQPIVSNTPLVEQDRSPTRYMRAWWEVAFPTRERLPFGPVSEPDGRGTVAFWDVFA
jgi:hypothetical protein